jgi:hypothetical protein
MWMKLPGLCLCVISCMTIKMLIFWVGWCLLFVICWPVALLAMALIPLIWLISLPLRLFGIVVEAVLAWVRALLLFPARLFR